MGHGGVERSTVEGGPRTEGMGGADE